MVIAIIGLLASVVLASLSSARERATWSKFDQEILQIKTATQLYREKNNGEWPDNMHNFNSGGLDALISELNTEGYYNGGELIPPVDGALYSYNAGKAPGSNSLDVMSCGDTNYNDAYYVILYETYDTYDSGSNVIEDVMYHSGGSGPSPGWYCTEIR